MTSFTDRMSTFCHGSTPFFEGMCPFSDRITSFCHGTPPFSDGMSTFCHGRSPFFEGMTPFTDRITPFCHGRSPFTDEFTSFLMENAENLMIWLLFFLFKDTIFIFFYIFPQIIKERWRKIIVLHICFYPVVFFTFFKCLYIIICNFFVADFNQSFF